MLLYNEKILSILANVTDPEVPVLNILDLGIVRDIQMIEDEIEITITPTYSGCPAMQTISTQVKMELHAHGYPLVKIKETLSPA